MTFLSKLFKKGTIIDSDQCIHIKTGKVKGYHSGVVSESNKDETIFHIFTHSNKGNNKPSKKIMMIDNFITSNNVIFFITLVDNLPNLL